MSKYDSDTLFEKAITCPYCGYVYKDSWDFLDGRTEETDEVECGECMKVFYTTAEVSISYSTWKIESKGE